MPKGASGLRMRIERSKLIFCESRRKISSRVVPFGSFNAVREQYRGYSLFVTRPGSCQTINALPSAENNVYSILISDIERE